MVSGLALQILNEIYLESSLELESFGILKDTVEHENEGEGNKPNIQSSLFHSVSSHSFIILYRDPTSNRLHLVFCLSNVN